MRFQISSTKRLIPVVIEHSSCPLKECIVCINGPINDETAHVVVASSSSLNPITLPSTCFGQAASMGFLLLAAGEKGERWSLPIATIMIHQPSGGYSGQAKDMTIHATGQSVDVIDQRPMSLVADALANHTKDKAYD